MALTYKVQSISALKSLILEYPNMVVNTRMHQTLKGNYTDSFSLIVIIESDTRTRTHLDGVTIGSPPPAVLYTTKIDMEKIYEL